MAGYERFTVSAGPPQPYEPPSLQGPPIPGCGSWLQYSHDRVTQLRLFYEMHRAASDARHSPVRDYGWVSYDPERGWTVFRKGPRPQDRRR